MVFIQKLNLSHFRSYKSACLEDLKPGLVVLYGQNGAGKTNILEAVSFLSPGRGLRRAKMKDIQHNQTLPKDPWSVSGLVSTAYGDIRIGTGLNPEGMRRIVRINGETARSQSSLSEYLSCVWLTPQMDRLFLEGPSGRRSFLDQLVFAFDSSHAGRIARYENVMRQRAKLLQNTEGTLNTSWLDGLEDNMVRTGVAISAARLHMIERLQQVFDLHRLEAFPAAKIFITGTLEEILAQRPAIEVEELFKYQLKKMRHQDSLMSGTATGPHKSDLMVVFKDKNMPAFQCSTGEQKALLISIVLAHSFLIAAEFGTPPILLLDEVSAHLDERRRDALYDVLIAAGGQVWITGTDKSLFNSLQGRACQYYIDNFQVVPSDNIKAA